MQHCICYNSLQFITIHLSHLSYRKFHIALVTLYLNHCICHIKFTKLNLSYYICQLAFVTLHDISCILSLKLHFTHQVFQLLHWICQISFVIIAFVKFHLPYCIWFKAFVKFYIVFSAFQTTNRSFREAILVQWYLLRLHACMHA